MTTKYAGQLVYTIKREDIGKFALKFDDGNTVLVSSFLGKVISIDIGKQVYNVNGTYQVESQYQLNKRLGWEF